MSVSASADSRDYGRFDALAEEFVERFRRGERPTIQEYVDRLPAMAEEIREMFPAMVEVERADGDARADRPPRPTLLAPHLGQIGDYRILREIGRGGMGVVYEAEQVSLGRRVALKVLPGHVTGDRKALERFRREAKSAARLHHTNIVPVFEVGRDRDVSFYAMQLIQGQGLDQVIDELRRLREAARRPGGADPARPEGPDPLATVCLHGEAAADPRRRDLTQMAGSLIGGRFATEGRDLPPGGTPEVPEGVPPGPEPTRGDLPTPTPDPEAPTSGSAVMPGGTHVSEIDASGRRQPYFRSVAQIGRQAAQGLAHAHARGVVHRDIKPPNLLLDADGVVWITDFGLAKADDDGMTATGDILGTLRYMAPERFRGEGDARADIFALGLTLYELLTLRPAYDSSNRMNLIEQIKSVEPDRPRSIDPQIPRDLETIVRKAIDKEPARRYQSADAMAEDLRRFLADEPIRARRQSTLERYARWARRHPTIAALGGALTAVLVLVTIGSLLVAGRFAAVAGRANDAAVAERAAKLEADSRAKAEHLARDAAETARVEAEAARVEADRARVEADRARVASELAEKEATAQTQRADREAEVAERNLFHAQMHLALQAWREHRGLSHMREILANWVPRDGAPDRRGWEWFYLNSLPHQDLRTLTEGGPGVGASEVAWDPAGGRLADGGKDGVIRIWDAARERTTLTLRGPGPASEWWGSRWFAWSPDGGTLAAGFGDGTVHLWETGSGRELRVLRGEPQSIVAVSYSPDGRRLAAWGEAGTVRIWDVEAGRAIRDVVHPPGVGAGAWSPDGSRIAAGHFDGTVTVSGPLDGDPIVTLRGHVDQIYRLAWSPDGSRIASTSGDFTARIWDVASGSMVVGPLRHSHGINSVAWEPGGARLATGSMDDSAKIWDAADGRELLTLRGHKTSVTSLAWNPDGRLASGGGDGSVRIWGSIRDQESERLPTDVMTGTAAPSDLPRITSAAWSPDGRRLATGGDDGKVRIWDPDARAEVRAIPAHEPRPNRQFGLIRSLAWKPDGTRLASASLDGTARVWEVATGREVFALPADRGAVWAAAWSPDGARLAFGSDDGTIRIVEEIDRSPKIRPFKAHDGRTRGLAWSPRGDRLASSGADGLVKLWDPSRGVELARMAGHAGWVMSVAWSPDGTRLASSGSDFLVIVHDATTGRKLSTMRGHNDFVDRVAWSPDGTRVASAGIDNSIRIWDPATGEETFVLRGRYAMFHDVSWNSDGARIAAASSDGHAWIWDATRGFERDTTPRALPYIDRRVASGTARGPELIEFAEAYTRAGRWPQALALQLDNPVGLRSSFAQLSPDRRREFASWWAGSEKTIAPVDNAERLEWARLAFDLEDYALAARLGAEALAADPTLDGPGPSRPRLDLARASAMAAGPGRSKTPLDDRARATLRRQALDRLEAELAARAEGLESVAPRARPVVVEELLGWRKDATLAGVRDPGALAGLPADEREGWRAFWGRVPESTPVVPTSREEGQAWRYTTTRQVEGWQTPGFDDKGWREGVGGFGAPGTPGAVVRTEWKTADIWLRREFTMPEGTWGDLWLMIHHDDDAVVFINGKAQIVAGWEADYRAIPLGESALSALKPGRNVLAVYCHQSGGNQYIDVGIAAMTGDAKLLALARADPDPLATAHRRAHELAASNPGEAEPLFRRALEGYRKIQQGPEAHLALDLTGDLALLLDRTGRLVEAEPLLRESIDGFRKQFGPEDRRTAGLMVTLGFNLIRQGKAAEAEPLLRDGLAIREKIAPDDWSTFNARSLLGASLAGQEKYAEAEPLLLSGFEGLEARQDKIPPQILSRRADAADRVVRLYEEWGKPDKAKEWRARLPKLIAEPGKQP